MQSNLLTLETANDVIQLHPRTLALLSYRSKATPEQEFIVDAEMPVFSLGILDAHKRYRLLHSTQCADVQVSMQEEQSRRTARAVYSGIAGYDIRVTCEVSAAPDDDCARWNIALDNRSDLQIVDAQYPFIVCRFDLADAGAAGSEAVLLPHGYGSGRLIQRPGEAVMAGGAWNQKMPPDSWRAWEFCSRNGDANHYPGMQFAQFLAYYNDRAGLYLACDDTQGHVKRFAALHHDPGLRLGVAHVGDWAARGTRALEYNTLTRTFQGDWYAAADMYREWTSRQKWFIPLTQRNDIPEWLTDSPVYITLRPQGILDGGPDGPVDDFLPYEKCLPLLQNVADKVNAPLAVILMGYERGGSWVFPDALPPVGGDDSMRSFIQSIRARGWHAGSFCSGTRWVTAQFWSNYDGREYYEQNGGADAVCREADGSEWRENWDLDWRPSYACCLGTQKTRQVARDYVRHLIDWGMDALQFLDQNNGSSTFPCFAADHEHAPVPGKWMAQKMAQFMAELHESARQAGAEGVAHSAEAGLNEYCLPLFQQTELRVFPPHYGVDIVPLYQYLFHECVVLQGMMGNAPEPYHLAIRSATNCVLGGIPGGVLTGDGTLLDKDTNNWAPWLPHVEDSDHAFRMIRAVNDLRRGAGKDFLVYGRMLRPAQINGIQMMEWTWRGRDHKIPAVFHSAWQAPDGRQAIVLANWTPDAQTVLIADDRLQAAPTLHVSDGEVHSITLARVGQAVEVMLPALSCGVVSTN